MMVSADRLFSVKITGRDGQVYLLSCDEDFDSLDLLGWELFGLVEEGVLDIEDAEEAIEAIESFGDE